MTVAGHLAAEGHDVAFVGTPSGLEAQLVTAAGIPFHAVEARGFDRSRPLSLLSSAAIIGASTMRARALIRRYAPDVAVGFGGYVSLPVGFAAVTCAVPLVLHEQNSVPGLANRVLARWARAVAVTYEESLDRFVRGRETVVTGNPVRASVLTADRERGRDRLGLSTSGVVLLVFGGSRGASHINDAFVRMAPWLMRQPSLQVLHVAGRIEAASVSDRIVAVLGGDEPRYRVLGYIDEMGDALAASDVVVARAGATSIAEITALGRPAVLIPYPFATDDHQTLNARAVEAAGGAIVVPDSALDTEAVMAAIDRLVNDAGERRRMAAASAALGRPDAADRLVRLVLSLADAREEPR